MIHPSRKGIYCDLCGSEVLITKGKIEYFSSNIKKVITRQTASEVDDVLDIDMCENCYRKLYDRVYKVSLVNDEKRKRYGKHIRHD